MVIDHIGILIFPGYPILRIIGRFSMPLFAWRIARGYRCTHDFKQYAVRIIFLAIVSQLPYTLAFKNGQLNVCFDLFFGLLSIRFYDSSLPFIFKWISIFSLAVVSQVLHFDYSYYGILTILLFYIFGNDDSVVYYQAVLTIIATFVLRYDPIQLISMLAPVLILLLEPIDFKIPKLFQYGFYPAHLLLFEIVVHGGVYYEILTKSLALHSAY